MKNLQILVSDVQSSKSIIKEAEPYFCGAISDLTKSQDLSLNYRLTDCEEEILLEGEVTGTLGFECSRCLESVKVQIKSKFCNSYPATQESINIEEESEQAVLLDLPEQPLCDSNCKGICAVCGKNKNIQQCNCSEKIGDPRWEKLRQIVSKEK